MRRIVIETKILKKNDEAALENRALLDRYGIPAVNFMSAPGAGKTSVLEHSLRSLKNELRFAVIEGDPATSFDAERIQALGVPSYQVTTGTCCHLDAKMVARALAQLQLEELDAVLIENVGNLMCPAEFNLGEQLRVMVYSCVEGAEKPKKYPVMFRTTHAVILNKIDLLPYTDVSLEELKRSVLEVNPTAVLFPLSCRTGEGVAEWVDWFRDAIVSMRTRVAVCA
ncbi:MAG: hydrogenase nickel incorporation protein HypB [Bryobacteraceae bacterium]|nr:hydrogenase nickel incorporation protein HypB [Bryobacteraceae bacterium]MDW8380420.1 hydrogenase nickel incorporation protein HypB [Bryobacterales bacterium]